ncbi:MAG TPA: hypothetical protein VGB37_00625 [Candidatus Lokiarchaeia archaeon]
MKKCFVCKEIKEEIYIKIKYGKDICKSCLPKFEKESKKEVQSAMKDFI